LTKTKTKREIKPKYFYSLLLLTLNVVLYKKNTQFSFHQILKYTTYSFKNL